MIYNQLSLAKDRKYNSILWLWRSGFRCLKRVGQNAVRDPAILHQRAGGQRPAQPDLQLADDPALDTLAVAVQQAGVAPQQAGDMLQIGFATAAAVKP